MTRETAIALLNNLRAFAEDDDEPAIDMAIESLQREEAEEKGYCHRIKPKEYLKKDAMQKLREIPRYLNGVKAKQIKQISADAVSEDTQTEERARFVAKETEIAHIEARLENAEKRLRWNCTANFVAEQLDKLKDMSVSERLKLIQDLLGVEFKEENLNYKHPSADAIHSGGVFVPNMEMPKACDYCLFHDSGWSWCKAKDKYCGDGKCPLIAVRGERND